ncbi:phosphoribosylaminoimidazolesuccinocarboxamide synthase [Dermatobacter hominis]|uniref:phosphoribosylaminoimidazolesuccinocarboxamide synthase n=1 Tax=Dermatobacter hominis TaxID=2884263 RepID=UPI001D125267|nr:phosphoribosylaminoimidazolesuccinocarboxamide synthase [Dermatobacter hominis]UDY34099.1 phosphoribosylaminoimidazolesuccinocarboxamide synthase [Dermatobacter hominis]
MNPPTAIPLTHVHRGKVRDLYDAGDGRLVMVASDRISAFDVVMDEPVPDKGRVLTAMSAHWFEAVSDVIGNHLISTDVADLPEGSRSEELAGRVMLCRRADMIPVECIVRGYLAGSAWKEYRSAGTIHGMPAPAGLVEADRLPAPIFTPSTKAAVGDHDENITFDLAVEILGGEVAELARDASLAIFRRASERAESAGFLLADTKFELGWVADADGEPQLVLADEVLTPDSSRYWAIEDWAPGATPQGYDKQPVRDYLESLDWDKTPPPPPLPAEVVEATADRYRQAYERICGRSLADWPG